MTKTLSSNNNSSSSNEIKVIDLAAKSAHSSLKRSRLLFSDDNHPEYCFIPQNNSSSNKSDNHNYVDPVYEASLARRKRMVLGGVGITKQPQQNNNNRSTGAIVVRTVDDDDDDPIHNKPKNDNNSLVLANANAAIEEDDDNNNAKKSTRILVKSNNSIIDNKNENIPTPSWQAPWKLGTVLSSHLGWVRSIAFDPTNEMFATGSADRTIKIWNFPKASVGTDDSLQLTLTGHIGTIRGLEFSKTLPYLFSAGEDKMVKCWDLETNQVIRHYHGHLSGVFCLALHPTIPNLLVTGGRDAVARLWDIRSKKQIHCLTGHDHTVGCVLMKSTDPQIITGSHDTTIKLWDIVAGKCFSTLTHHQKSIRALVKPSFENTFVSGGSDCIKKWYGRDGKFINTWRPLSSTQQQQQQQHSSSSSSSNIIHTMSVNDDGVTMSGTDDGTMYFWDYKTGYNYQTTKSQVQPGSLVESENAILTSCFDLTGTRLITGEADKTIKIWKQDEEASELSHPIQTKKWRKHCMEQMKQRY